MGFAEKIKSLFPKLVEGATGKPNVDAVQQDAEGIFENMPWSTWPEARLVPVLRYLRGNSALNAPQSWLKVFPTAFEVLHRLEQKQAETG